MRHNHTVHLGGLLLLASMAHIAWAAPASLALSPASGVFPIGEPFGVEVRIDTGGAEVGTADATIVFDTDDLEFVSVSDEGSVMSRILVDSTTVPGRIEISGFTERARVPYAGSSGLIARVTFLPKRNVATEVRFAQGAATPPLTLGASVGSLANLLTDLRSATYTLVPRETIPPAQVAGAYTDTGEAFLITSLPALDEGAWYGTTSVKLAFSLPENVTDMRSGVSTDSNGTPDTAHPIPVNSVTLTDVGEGKQYFLLQFKYDAAWGGLIRHPLNVDLTPPEYVVVREAERTDPSDPRVSFEVEARDALSGVARYEVAVDGGESEAWNGEGAYRPTELEPGEHVLTVTAYDQAGNKTEQDLTFFVKSLEPPVLTDAPERVLTGDSISVRGTTYPNAEVRVFTSFNDGEANERIIESDPAGAFVATIVDGARSGKYTVWFQVTDQRGAQSPISIKRSIEVSQPYIMLFGTVAVTYLSIIVPLIGLIILLGLVLWLGYTYVRGYRARIRRETDEAYSVVNEEFEALRDDIRKQIGMLERAQQSRELTREEMRIFTELSKKLDRMETHIEEEIGDITELHTPRQEARPSYTQHERTAQVPASEKSEHTIRLGRR